MIKFWRVVFGQVDTRHLDVSTCHEMHLVPTIVLNLEDPLIFDAPVIRGHMTFMSHAPHLLLVHFCKFLANCLSFFLQESLLGWFQALLNVWGSSGTGLVLFVTMARWIRKFKFLLALFSLASCLKILLASLLYKACSIFMQHTTFVLIVVLGVILTLSSTSSLKKICWHFFMSSSLLKSLTILLLLLLLIQEPFWIPPHHPTSHLSQSPRHIFQP